MKTYLIYRGLEFDTSAVIGEGTEIERIRFFDKSSVENVGGIYVGKVLKVEKSLNCAFIDIGTGRSAFLQLSDWSRFDDNGNPVGISPGKMCVVQLFRESVGDKGPRVTGKLTVKSSFGVLLPHEKGVFVSREIEEEVMRNSLARLAENAVSGEFGVIVRTLSRHIGEPAFANEIEKLMIDYHNIVKAADLSHSPALIRGTSPFDEEMEAFLKGAGDSFVTNDEIVYGGLVDICEAFGDKDEKKRIRLSKDSRDLLDEFSIRHDVSIFFEGTIQVEKTKSELVRNLTEAFTIYDVNSASSVGAGTFSENYFQVNRAAILKVYDDIVKYNISGTILVDLIGLESENERNAILSFARKKSSRYDKGITAHGVSKLGILEVTRKKEKLSMPMLIGEKCRCCSSGVVLGARYVLGWMFEGVRHYESLGFEGVLVLANSKFLNAYDIISYAKECGLSGYVSVKQDEIIDDGRFKIRPIGSSTSLKK